MSQYRKALVAIAGVVAQAVALGVLNGTVLHWANVLLAVLTALGVYGVANEPAPLANPPRITKGSVL